MTRTKLLLIAVLAAVTLGILSAGSVFLYLRDTEKPAVAEVFAYRHQPTKAQDLPVLWKAPASSAASSARSGALR